ncbi:RAP protein, putative, partial [Hepatocystis sp. ex Piliocolobus tephrosceles]
SDKIGSDTIGSDKIGSDTIGSDTTTNVIDKTSSELNPLDNNKSTQYILFKNCIKNTNKNNVHNLLAIVKEDINILNEITEDCLNSFFNCIYKNTNEIKYSDFIFLTNTLYKLGMKNKMRDLAYTVLDMLHKNKKKKNNLTLTSLENSNLTSSDKSSLTSSDNLTLSNENNVDSGNNIINRSNICNDSMKIQYNEEIELCIKFINTLNNSNLYFSEFYDYLIKKINYMSNSDLVLFAEECFKHFLRTKHYLDKIVNTCIHKNKIENFNYNQIKLLYYFFHRFCKEYKEFYDLTLYIIIEKIQQVDLPFYQLLLKISINFKNEQKYVDLVTAIGKQMVLFIQELKKNSNFNEALGSDSIIQSSSTDGCSALLDTSIDHSKKENTKILNVKLQKNTKEEIFINLIKCLQYFEYNKNNYDKIKILINLMYELINENITLIKLLCVEDIVYSISCFASYNKKIILYNTLLDILCDKSNELLHAKNICLWIYPIISLSKIGWFHLKYISNLFEYIQDSYVLSRLSVFQLLKLLSSIVKINVYDQNIYKIIITKLYNEWNTIKTKLIDVATFLWSCAYVNIIYKPLFDSSYELVIDLVKKNDSFPFSDKTKSLVNYKNCFVNITWAFIVANYHKTHDNFYLILDYTFINRNPNSIQAFKRLHQIADACFKEIPQYLINLKNLDTLYLYCTDKKCKTMRTEFSIYKKEKDAIKIRTKILKELCKILNNFSISYDLHFEPYNNSPYIIDILLNEKMKIGICLFGKEHLMRTVSNSRWDYLNTGLVALQMRVLFAHGW